MNKKSFSKKIYLGITGEKNIDWQSKLAEINKLTIKEAAVFIERFNKKQREKLYKALLKSAIKEVPLVHLRNDVSKEEIQFFIKNFKTKYFNIHEDHFKILNKWNGYWKNLFLEMNCDSRITEDVKVRQIGGFCIDLAHFKIAMTEKSEEYYYVFFRRHDIKFVCNHLNGYSSSLNEDLHTITSLKDFSYLKTLPKYLFGKVIALEVENSIKEQIKFKKYITSLLDNYFNY